MAVVKIIFAVFFCYAQVSWGALAPASTGGNPSLEILSTQVKEQESLIQRLRADIESLEEQMGDGNKRYLSLVDNLVVTEEEFNRVSQEQKKLQEELGVKLSEARKILTQHILAKLSEDQGAGYLLSNQILMKKLKIELEEISKQYDESKKQGEKLQELSERYAEYQATQLEIATIVNEMEWRKNNIVAQYMEEDKKREELMARYNRVRGQFARSQARSEERSTALRFRSPLKDFSAMDYGDKGVSFDYRGRQPVLSTQTGQVVYSGELSTFGNVVMIDHGNDTRSVILGDFVPTIEKGLDVQAGDVVGYTIDRLNSGSVYFEVRNNNKVQNTFNLMDSRFIESLAVAGR